MREAGSAAVVLGEGDSLVVEHDVLGVAVLPRDMIPAGIEVCHDTRLPALKDTEIALIDNGVLSAPAQRLKEHIVRSLGRTILLLLAGQGSMPDALWQVLG